MLGFIAGILNYGIFPAVSSEFFVYFLKLPEHVHVASLLVPTKVLIMAGYLSIALWMMTVGGQVTLLVTHCVEGILSHAIFVVVVIAIFFTISWSQMRTALINVPPGHSMVNPFDQTKTKDFNFWFSMIYLVMSIYGTMTAQKDNGFSSAGRTAHETRMGGLLGWWRIMARASMLLVVTLGAFTLLKQPSFAGHAVINGIGDSEVRSQMTVPIVLRYLLPAGVKGLFCTMMVLGLISGDASHMLTWGGIFIQDVILPLRTKPLSPRQHVLILRLALGGVALFALLFSVFFHQIQDIVMWWAETEGIFACWAGIAIIGGLYWKKGTTPAAWAALLAGVGLDLTGIILPYFFRNFPYNGRQVQIFSAIAAVLAYVIVSLLTSQNDFDLDQMLHRGRYAIAGDSTPEARHKHHRFSLARLLGFDDDYTFWDKIVAGGIFFWSMFWLAVVLIGTAWNVIHPWPQNVWVSYWFVAGLILPILVCVITLFWFGIGGVLDIRSFFRLLSSAKHDASDDGTVPQRQKSTDPELSAKAR
jgi:SSS family solute:Na+ symporter